MITSRAPRWTFDLLDNDNRRVAELRGVEGGNCQVVALSRLGWSGALSLTDRGQDIDWLRHRMRATYDPGIPGEEPWPVCTMMFTSPTRKMRNGVVTWEVALLSLLAIVEEGTVEDTYSLPTGTPVVPTVIGLIRSAGVTQITATESDAVTRSSLVWEPGTPKLTIINDLLESANYWALWVDGAGMYRVEPYEPPSDRQVSRIFAAGETAIHSPEWNRTQDLASVPNRFMVVSEGTDEEPAIVGIAVNEDPESPYSYQARGRWVTAVDENAEVENQAAADALAQRRLIDRMSPVGKFEVDHAVVDLDPNVVVEFAPLSLDPRRATVQSMKWNFKYDTLISAEWREV